MDFPFFLICTQISRAVSELLGFNLRTREFDVKATVCRTRWEDEFNEDLKA